MPVEALVLWDVDKTLVDVSAVSHEIYAVAFEQVVGRPLGQVADMVGRTEHAILEDTLALNGVSATKFDAYYDALGWAAGELQGRMREAGRALPGARAAIAVVRRQGVVQSVATGNIRSIAETKLAAFDLLDGIDFDVGGYGSDGSERSELIRRARDRASTKYGRTISPASVVVVGDTPLDIEGARAAGARAVGVATGASTVRQLGAAGADAVLDDLTSPDDVVRAVYGAPPALR
jgi:phosphoglycolate phosphatase-like HAD superfamily hydrolase